MRADGADRPCEHRRRRRSIEDFNRKISTGLAKYPAIFYTPPLHVVERKGAILGSANNRSLEEIKTELKRLLVEYLSLEEMKPEDITDDMNLFGSDGVGLDSLDGVEIVVILHRHYGLDVKAIQKGREVFRSISTMAPYVLANATK